MTGRVVITGIGLITPVGLNRKSTWSSLMKGESGVDYITSFDAEGFETRIAAEILDFERRRNSRAARSEKTGPLLPIGLRQHSRGSGPGGTRHVVAKPRSRRSAGRKRRRRDYHAFEPVRRLARRGPRRVSPFLIPMMLSDMASGQVSMMIGAKGPNFNTVSACASGADAIGEGAEMIRRGRVDVAVAGGSEAAICPIGLAGFSACMALSKRNDDPTGASRPFDAGRDGFVLGEGAGVMVLEDYEHARSRGATVLAEFAGYGSTSDAFHVTQPTRRARARPGQ